MKLVSEQTPDLLRRSAPLVLGAFLIWVLWHKSQTLDWDAVAQAFHAIPGWRWLAAVAATGVSFWAVAQYDVVAHRHFDTRIPQLKARLIGGATIAVGQTTGFGPAVGAALRWRMMPDLSHGDILRVTGFVTLGFLTAWCVLAFAVAVPVMAGLGALVLLTLPLTVVALSYALLRLPMLQFKRTRITLPTVTAMWSMIGLAAVDLIFAGLALYLLLPAEMAVPLWPLIAAFTLALGAGMIGGTPGGVGPFELAILALMPSIEAPALAAGLIGFRLVYYVGPCLLGTAYAIWARPAHAREQRPHLPGPLSGPRAEHAIAAQCDTTLIASGSHNGCALVSPQSLTLFLGPTSGRVENLLPELKRQAQQQNRVPCLYKLDARNASKLRAAGWSVLPFAVEAMITPSTFTLDGSERRQLRRALRKAEKSGITVTRLDAPNWSDLHAVHKAWVKTHGAERGFTMGRFCPLYLRGKPMFGAWYQGRLIAYCSGVEGKNSLSLDLMRHYPDLPQGTMHALITHMIRDCAERGIGEFSLAALPHPSLPPRLADCAGLSRFKTAFAPRWKPLYIAAPSLAQMVVAAVDIRQSITSPAPLALDTRQQWQADKLLDPAVDTQDPKAQADSIHQAS